jgi:zinc D-Ala-D-Ala carboxypeptidase
MTCKIRRVSPLTFGLRLLIAAFVLVAAFASIHGADARSCDPCPTVASDNVNLRSGPGKNYSVTWVIPEGTKVIASNSQTNGYSKVTVNGREGWAYRQYLVSPDAPAVTGTLVTVDYLNFRAGPGSGEKVMRVLPPLASVEATGQIVNGYRYVYYDGMQGWVSNLYLGSGSTMKTTTALNLRSKASTSSTVKQVLPAGTKVQLTGDESNGFVSVKVNGASGWVYKAYLA